MKILILEDEQSVSSAIRFSLQKKGHSIVESHNPIDALNRIEKENFEFLVLDYDLYLLSGLDVLKLFRTNDKSTPVVIITSNEIESINNIEYLQKNACEIISKDKPIKEIINNIESVLSENNHN
ncbi:MAG: response regulator [Ignavibacteriae bacterium]|nr:response regulator [Ignavibacteriota bacterium]